MSSTAFRLSWRYSKSIVKRNWLQFRYAIGSNLSSLIFEPFLYLLVIGFGLGQYVDNVNGQTFLDFYFPGLLCMSAMMISFLECSFGSYTKLNVNQYYKSLLSTPLRQIDIYWGEIVWSLLKVYITFFALTLLAFVMDALDSINIIFCIIPVSLISVVFSMLGIWVGLRAKTYESIQTITAIFILPISFCSGTIYSLEQLPIAAQVFSYISPLSHGVYVVRQILLNEYHTVRFVLHFLFLIFLILLTTPPLTKHFIKRLRKSYTY